MTDNIDSINVMTADTKSDKLNSGKCSCVNQRHMIKEKYEEYYGYYQTFKDKVVTFIRESVGRQNITVDDESKKSSSNVTSSK
ncbi:unnamed protein product [Rhizophagus irregularis]|nr:unnamed protein product [Rhizophagus irregularis]